MNVADTSASGGTDGGRSTRPRADAEPAHQSAGERTCGAGPGPVDRVPSAVPPGWEYNPSAIGGRVPSVALAVVGCGIAASLATWQHGMVSTVWDPFFANAERVLDSPVSFALPVSDAALGAGVYATDAAAASVGGARRWAQMPWVVLVFGIIALGLGIVGVGLTIAQPVFFEAWCTLCLASAAVSIAMVPRALPEVLATLQHLRRVRDTPRASVWRALWGTHPPAPAAITGGRG